jgi:hypothetical protein
MRKFRDTTNSDFATFELPRETAARKRRSKAKGKETEEGTSNPASTSQKPKTLNLFTYKWHALADYVRFIRLFGGTDGFSTQVVGASYSFVTCLLIKLR